MIHQCYAVNSNNWIPWAPQAIRQQCHSHMHRCCFGTGLAKVYIVKRITQGRTEPYYFPDSRPDYSPMITFNTQLRHTNTNCSERLFQLHSCSRQSEYTLIEEEKEEVYNFFFSKLLMCYIGMITMRSSIYMQCYTLQHTAFSLYIKRSRKNIPSLEKYHTIT